MTRKLYDLRSLLVAAGITIGDAPEVLGLGGPEYRKYRDRGISRDVAERKAIKVGLHPYEVWPEMVEHDLLAASKPCEARGCDEMFVPRNSVAKYCSKRCRAREHRRRHYARNPEPKRQRHRQYLAETAEYQRIARRRRYRANAERERAARRARYAANPGPERERAAARRAQLRGAA